MIMRELKESEGLIVGGRNITNVKYADDTAIITTSQEKLQAMLEKVVDESRKMGPAINCKKTERMIISKKKQHPVRELKVDGKNISQVKRFSYLGSVITDDGKFETEIRRIGMAKDSFKKMQSLFKDRKLKMKTKFRVLQCYIYPILTYASEFWNIPIAMVERLKALEMWFLRRIMRISWTELISNKEVLERAGMERSLLKNIRKRQLEFLGHVMRKGGLERLAVAGKIKGKRSRGRPCIGFIKSLSSWMGVPSETILTTSRERDAMEIHDSQRPARTRHLEEEGK